MLFQKGAISANLVIPILDDDKHEFNRKRFTVKVYSNLDSPVKVQEPRITTVYISDDDR